MSNDCTSCSHNVLLLILYDMAVSCHSLSFPVLLSNQQWSPPLTLQASHCSTFRIVCAVPSIAAFCSESIECFPGTASKFSLKLLVTIPVAPIITGTIVHFRFHIRCTSIHKLLYFNFYYYYYYYYYWRDSPPWARASTFTRFLDLHSKLLGRKILVFGRLM